MGLISHGREYAKRPDDFDSTQYPSDLMTAEEGYQASHEIDERVAAYRMNQSKKLWEMLVEEAKNENKDVSDDVVERIYEGARENNTSMLGYIAECLQ